MPTLVCQYRLADFPPVVDNHNPATGAPFQPGQRVYVRCGGGDVDVTLPWLLTDVLPYGFAVYGRTKRREPPVRRFYRWGDVLLSPAEV